MPELVREWPRMLARALSNIRPISGRTGCYIAEVDLSEDEVRALNLFEASARHEHVSFKDPITSQQCFAYLNTPIGLGSPRESKGHVARVRISFTDVHPLRFAEPHPEHAPLVRS